MARAEPELKIKVQILCAGEIAMGPGKADLLEAIGRAGSISGAARLLGMSYRRAWLLVDAMNRCWQHPLVETAPGGSARGGARTTEEGARVLAVYRRLQAQAEQAREGVDWGDLSTRLLPLPKERQKD